MTYGGLRGYGSRRRGFGPPPPGGGMPHPEVLEEADEGVATRRPRRRSDAAIWRRAVVAVLETASMVVPIVVAWWLAATELRPAGCEQVVGFEGERVLLDCNPGVTAASVVAVVAVAVAVIWLVVLRAWADGRPTFWGRWFRVQVVESTTGGALGRWRSAVRLAVRTFVSPILGVGFLWIRRDREGRTFHDLAARSAVSAL